MCNECKIFTEKGKYYCPESETPFKYCPFCGEPLKEQKYSSKFWSYVESLEQGSDRWREIMNLGNFWFTEGYDLDERIEQYLIEEEEKNR